MEQKTTNERFQQLTATLKQKTTMILPVRSWTTYTVLWLINKAHTHVKPCFSLHIYVVSLNWSTMSATSMGYDDIVPVRLEEYIVGILCQIIWADVIDCDCNTLSKGHPVEERFC